MPRRDVHGARAGIHRNEIGCENGGLAVQERMARCDLLDLRPRK